MNLFLRRYIYRFIIIVPAVWLFITLFVLQSDGHQKESVPHSDHRIIKVDQPSNENKNAPINGGNKLSHSTSSDVPRPVHDKHEQVAAPLANPDKRDPDAPGEMGKPFQVDKEKLPPDERRKYDEGFQKNAFNAYASDLISIHRSLPDVRDPGCRKLAYTAKDITASVVMCFHNEAWSVLLRSVHSILDRSPPHLLKEIILVDDFSDMGKSWKISRSSIKLFSF